MKKRVIISVGLLILIPLSVFIYSTNLDNKPEKKTLSAVVDPSPTEKPKRWISESPTPTPLPLPKDSYTIAVYGDSMVDTAGERLEYLEHALVRKYPKTDFKLYNYGIGGENVEMGLARWKKEFSNRDRNYPSIVEVAPDVIILGSFSYNTFSPHDRERHKKGLREIIFEAKKITSEVYLMVEIAPLGEDFGKGPHGPNMTPSAAIDQSNRIIEQLDDSLVVAQELNLPLIDVYTPSQMDGKYGEKSNVNLDDGIHPSVNGHTLTANIIVDTLKFK